MKKELMRKVSKLIELSIRPHRAQFIWSMILSFFGAILGALTPFIIGLAITELSINVMNIAKKVEGAAINMNYIAWIVILLLICTISRQLMNYFAGFLLAGGVQSSFRDLRGKINDKINRLPVSYFDANSTGTILNTVTNDVDTVVNAMQQSLLAVVYFVTSIIMTFIMMFIISVPLGLICIIIIPLSFVISRIMMRRSQGHFLKMQNYVAELNGYIQERYSGFTVVKLYNAEQKSIDEFGEINQKLNESGFKGGFISSLIAPLIELLINLIYIAMIVLTGYAVIFSGMPLGNMQAFVQYIWLLYDPVGQITQLATPVQTAFASMERIVNFMEQNEDKDESEKPATLDLSHFAGNVTFDRVRFSYTPAKPLISDLSFVAKPGQKIAIVGATGAGKTTIINLLMRFYNIDAGDITIDGDNIYDMRREQTRSLFGMVLQDAWLYHATIAENIRFGRLGATDEEIIEAAKSANVDHFIRTLPGGYQMMINAEADNISLGQKQLLTIARAILADPHILILDEATSSVDTRLEMLIQVAMKRAMHGRTSFVIAHRLSTVRDADLILVLEQGDIVEQGTHDELIESKGIYEGLYNSQFAET